MCCDDVDDEDWIRKEDLPQIEGEFVDAVDQNADGNKDPTGSVMESAQSVLRLFVFFWGGGGRDRRGRFSLILHGQL